MKVRIILIFTTAILILSGCATPPYVPVTKNLIQKYGITSNEFHKLQYYSSKYTQIHYVANTITVNDTSIERSGTISQKQLTERYSYDIDKLTPGILIDVEIDSVGLPLNFYVQFDTSSTSVKYSFAFNLDLSSSASDRFRLANETIKYFDKEYTLDDGLNSELYIKMAELDKLIINLKKVS